MDEPTNHLDMEMRLALTLALQTFNGAVVLVTHDRHLLRNTVDELLLVHDGRVEEYAEDVSAYEQWVLGRQQRDSKSDSGAAAGGGNRKQQRQEAARRREEMRPLKKKIEAAEKAIARLEQERAALEKELADSALYEADRKQDLDRLMREQGRLRQQSEEQEELWMDLQHQLETLEQADAG
jgi:ATP-binding cassette subfamily F protein 3